MSDGMRVEIQSSGGMMHSGMMSQESSLRSGISGGGVVTRFNGQILSDTTAGWNLKPGLKAQLNTIYVYTDYQTVTEGGVTKFVPGIKVGDGMAYLIDIPFTDKVMVDHINDHSVHVSQSEKDFWNNKVSAFYLDGTLILTTD